MTNTATALDTLTSAAANVANADDALDMLGAIRFVELAAEQVRRCIVADARAAGSTWQQIADVLGTSRQAAHERFGR